MTTMILDLSEHEAEQRAAGGKAASLARMLRAGYPVPDGFVILSAAFDGDELRPDAWAQARTHLARLRAADPGAAFAVRSSAQAEDSAQASFAGEFESVLNLCTDEEVRAAIGTVYRSRDNERVLAYSRAKGVGAATEVAVVVQQLVRAECSGVLFSADPVTGRRDQAVISAAWGLGEAVVQGLVTPDTLTVDKSTGRVVARQTGDKRVMTALAQHGTAEQAVPATLRGAPVLSDAAAAELVRLGASIEALYGMPMDIEWARSHSRFAIVQARPITALPDGAPEPPPPSQWPFRGVAMRNNIVELMPDPLTPLFDTLGRAGINASLGRVLDYFLGRPGIMPEEIIVSVNGYAYNNGSVRADKALLLVLDSAGIMRRMFRGAVERWTVAGRPRYVATVESWQARAWRELGSADLLRATRDAFEAAIDAYTALISGVIPAAWMTEALFTAAYRLLRQRGDPPAPVYLLGFDSAPLQAEKSLYDLAQWARERSGLRAYLTETPVAQVAAQLAAARLPDGVDEQDWHAWQQRLDAHLQRYGHAIYTLDFANPVAADDPAPLLETCKLFMCGKGANPYTRQEAATARREEATRSMLGRLKGLRLKLFRKLLAPAQRYAPLREDGLADVGLIYPLLRRMFLELGRRCSAAGMIAQREDIFWLRQDELEQAALLLDRGEKPGNLEAAVAGRKAEWRARRRVTPPERLPHLALPRLRLRQGNSLKGVPASPGRVTARACVLRGPQDFAQMQAGDVLVAAITTPAWTPLFARAAAVVTDVGGPLSHGSIVAREYGIPAVLGTGTATRRIASGQTITVDGSAGTVVIEDESLDARPQPPGRPAP